MQVAYVHDWLVTYRGGEKVLDALLDLYPEAPVYTLFYDRAAMPARIQARDIRVPALLNKAQRLRKLALPLLPRMIESLPTTGYDLLISTSSCVAKGVRKGAHAKHLCYLHSPMRYIWDQQEEYIAGVQHIPGAAWGIRALTPGLRAWDIASSTRVDRFLANSTFVAERARRCWGLETGVLPPPIELERFVPRSRPSPVSVGGSPAGAKPYLLAAGALVSYKRFDLAIAACERLGRDLVIAGSGPMERALREQAGPHTRFEIQPTDERFTTLLAEAEALLFPGVEDFGMIAVEAMASGTPVLAYAAGGARDFIVHGETGLYFHEPTAESLATVIAAFDPRAFDPQRLAQFASRFNRAAFLHRVRAEIQQLLGGSAV